MKTAIHKLFKRERAQAMVEFALVFPLILLITYSIIEFGRLLFIYTVVTSAAREGARYGAAAGDVGGHTPHYADCDGILDASRRTAVLIGILDENIVIDYDHGPDTVFPEAPDCPPEDVNGLDLINLGDRIEVTVTGHWEPIIAFLGYNGFDITSQNARTILTNVDIIGSPPPSVATITKTPTDAPPPTSTNTPTHTPTPTNTDTSTPTPTNTEVGAPTATPTPTGTNTATPTITPTPTNTVAPTPTPSCIIGSGPLAFYSGTNNFTWSVTNIGADPVLLIRLNVAWPDGISPKPRFQLVSVDANTVWTANPGPDVSPVLICVSGCPYAWNAGLISDRQINPGQTVQLNHVFSRAMNSGTYSLNATFENLTSGGTCTASASANYTKP